MNWLLDTGSTKRAKEGREGEDEELKEIIDARCQLMTASFLLLAAGY